MPAILNVNGHVGPPGKAIEYKQKRCINYAKHGILALSLEWLAFGELDGSRKTITASAAHLDLVGMNGVGLFYLAMRRGLDYLYEHPNVDRSRLGVTGLVGRRLADHRAERARRARGGGGSGGRLRGPGDGHRAPRIHRRRHGAESPRIFATARIIRTWRPCARRARRC